MVAKGKKRITITLSDDLVSHIDEYISQLWYIHSRSEFIEMVLKGDSDYREGLKKSVNGYVN